MSNQTPDGNLLKQTITVQYGEFSYEFRVPTFRDVLTIQGLSASIRRQFEPDSGTNAILSVDLIGMQFYESVARFQTLIERSSNPYCFTPSKGSQKPTINFEDWPDDFPVMEVVAQFNQELALFRETRDRDRSSSGPAPVSTQ